MDADTRRVLDYLTEVEEAAEDVLCTKQQIVDLDSKRNRNREALSAIKNQMSGTDTEKVKVCFGSMFITFPKLKTTQMIDKDQRQLDEEIKALHKGLKEKVNRLNEIQGKPELKGYRIAPLSSDEAKVINSILKG